MHEDWSISEEGVNGIRYLGIDHASENEEDTCLLAPISEESDAPYGIYFSNNPAIVFDRSRLAGVLLRSVPDAIEFLMARVTEEQRRQGEPFYVVTRGAE